MDPKSVKKLEQIYVNLSLLTGDRIERQKEVRYEEVIEMLQNEQNIARIAFIGEAGVGKTTLLAKIAYEWAVDRQLTDIDILLYVPLREFKKGARIGDILDMYIARGIGMDNQAVEDFMRATQRRTMFLLDGLDEYVGDIRQAEPTDSLVGVMRGDDFKSAPVIVTTRPWCVEQISSTPTLDLRYSLVVVEGFKKKDVVQYVQKFFADDNQSANDLIGVMTEDSVIAQHMAPYPIFCCMLCNMWKSGSKRDTIKSFETFSDLFEEMINSLMEHWLGKEYSRDYRKRYTKSLEQVGKIALHGLLNDKLTFTEQVFDDCKESMKTASELGVLSMEMKFNPNESEKETGQGHISFAHKLFQEYLGGLYLSSLYIIDKESFLSIIKDNIMSNYQKFRYLLYFTAAHGRDQGYAGKPLMKFICQEVHDDEFIVDIAFECHEELAVLPVVEHFQETCTHLGLSTRIQFLKRHTWSGYMHIFGSCGRQMVRNQNTLLP